VGLEGKKPGEGRGVGLLLEVLVFTTPFNA